MKISSHILLLVVLCSGLSGCASFTPSGDDSVTNHASNGATSGATSEATSTSVAPSTPQVMTDPLPGVALTDEILFKVVSAEIAFQRGDWATAYATMLSVTQQTQDPRLAKRTLEMALIAKQPGQAFIAAKLWREYAPHSDEATQYYLGFMVINNNFSEIKSILAERLQSATPRDRGVIMLQAQRLLMRSPDQASAFALLEEVFGPYKDYVESHLALAQAAHVRKNSTRAMAEANAALALQPDSQLAVLTLAQVSTSTQDAGQALASFLKKNPSANEVRQAYATMLIEQKQFEPARHQFELILADNPQDPSTLYTLGVLALQMGDVPAAEKNLTRFLAIQEASGNEALDPTSALIYLSQIADERNDGVAALDWLSRIPSLDGKNTAYFSSQMRKAQLLAKYNKLDEALAFLHAYPATPAEHTQVIQMEAELLRDNNRVKEAYALLQTAVADHPENTDLLYDYAMMAEKLDHLPQMESALRTVIRLTPKNQHAYNALGYSWADRSMRLPEARELIQKALELAPDDPFIMDSMGWLEFRQNNAKVALPLLQKAYDIRPDVEIAAHLGEVLWSLGNKPEAKKIWQEAIKKEPGNALLKSTVARFSSLH